TERAACLGGIILIGVGIYNLVKKDEKNTVTDGSAFRQSIITGFAVGLDGAAANLSLSLMGVNAFYVPLTIALMHALMISAGIILAENPLAKKADGFGIVPPCVLIMLGVYKLMALLF
ncbi:MAG: manganese efflux pump, partial [Candidatus Borkfalkiaceae bacterium]|nr:manganese efflux pump [Christensenellaceae bacterium]